MLTATELLILAASPAGRGGIQRLTREVTLTADRLLGPEAVTFLPIDGGGRELAELNAVGRLAAKATYTARAIKSMRKGKSSRPAAILCLHVGLSPLARVLAHGSRCRYAVAAYGLEVWGDLPWPERWGLRGADEVWSISEFTSNQLVAHGVPASRIRKWPLGLPPELTVTVDDRRLTADSRRVLTVARLTRRNAYKGVDALLAAWPAVLRQLPDAELHVVGDGEMRPSLERLAELLGVGHSVSFLGSVDDARLNEEYASADVFALPGRSSLEGNPEGEGFGIVFLEAAAAGLPSVGGRAGGIPEAVLDQETGLLVDPEDSSDISRSVIRLLSDRELAGKLGRRGAELVRSERSTARSREHLSGLISGLVAST